MNEDSDGDADESPRTRPQQQWTFSCGSRNGRTLQLSLELHLFHFHFKFIFRKRKYVILFGRFWGLHVKNNIEYTRLSYWLYTWLWIAPWNLPWPADAVRTFFHRIRSCSWIPPNFGVFSVKPVRTFDFFLSRLFHRSRNVFTRIDLVLCTFPLWLCNTNQRLSTKNFENSDV